MPVAVGVAVGEPVGLAVGVRLGVGVRLAVGVVDGVGVTDGVGVMDGVRVGDGVSVSVAVGVAVGVAEAVLVGVGVSVCVAVAVGVAVGVLDGVAVAVGVGVWDAVGVAEGVGVAGLTAQLTDKDGTAYDLFGVDHSTSAEWAYVWGLKGRFDEDTNPDPVMDKRLLNAYNRGLYRDEIVREVDLINRAAPAGAPRLTVPDVKFHRAIGEYAGQEWTVEGQAWKGKGSYDDYLASVLPTKEDDEVLAECFKGDWIAAKAA